MHGDHKIITYWAHCFIVRHKIKTHPITCVLNSNMHICNLCKRSLLYASVFSTGIFLVVHYAKWFPIKNHGKFIARYLEL